ncbi:MAG: UbiD family decarboxylase [Ignavibacteriales bacterium]|nr:UbiD family decarboxylase [Ignavibacteriales bacterium]
MQFPALGEFVRFLESVGELHRVSVEVDPAFEITEIAARAVRERKPALLFERVRGSRFPLAINVYASERRIELALGKHPEEFGTEIIHFAEQAISPKPFQLWKHRSVVRKAAVARSRKILGGVAQEIEEEPRLDTLPIQTCWPEDGGKFITQGQVLTYDPLEGKRNVGMYRLHVFNERTTGMHWQIQKGGGFHYRRAERLGQDLEVAVALGTDPALLLASIAALPEGIDEVQFASFLRGKPMAMTRGRKISIQVPAQAEFILEGIVPHNERKMEGPFGDHFGHYSAAAPFPVFHVKTMTRRRYPIYPATVVGIPPMEDKFLGDATQHILGPLARLIHKEVRDVWAYYEAGFHNLLVVSVEERYKKEAMKAALGLLGTGQLSLTKCLVLVSAGVDVRNRAAVLHEIRSNYDPHFDFVLIPKVPLDTLDFTSYTMELGSKMILDATRKSRGAPIARRDVESVRRTADQTTSDDRRILSTKLWHDCLLAVKVRGNGKDVIESLVKRKELAGIPMIAAVSSDVDIEDATNTIWGIFTRFDCERDIVFTRQEMIGISPVYEGVMGIDATWKRGYPNPLEMDSSIKKIVDERWDTYWQ